MGSRKARAEDRNRWEAEARRQLGDPMVEGRVPLLAPGPEHPTDYALEHLGFPGSPPYTRGIQPTMYRGRLWTYRQYSGFGDATETNRRFRYLLQSGQTGLSVAFDLPTQIGLDSDHRQAKGEVGRVGVPITSVGDMRTLFGGIDLATATVSMTINATAPILTSLLLAVGEEQGLPRSRLSGTVQNDILKEYIARGTYIYPPVPSVRLATDLAEFATREMPQWNYISVSGYHMREAGSSAAQEIAFTMANAIAYVDAARSRGLDVDAFLPRLSFFFSADRHFLEEIAKFRAARRLWATITEERFAARNPRSRQLRFHTQTAGSSLTAQQPELNVVRTSLEALSAVLGGTQSLHTNALDEALGLPEEGPARLALRTQQILAEESGVASTVDPLGGAYAIEALTDRLEADARDYLGRIDAMGGALVAVERGYFTREIAEEAYRSARAREKGEDIVVGVNRYTEGRRGFSLFPTPSGRRRPARAEREARERRQRERLARWRRSRNAAKVESSLDRLRRTTEAGANVMPDVIAAVVAGATVGEISDVWRTLFGEFRPPSPW